VTGIYDHDLVAHDEVLVAAPFRMDLDQHIRHGDDAHMRRYRGADADCEVDAIDTRHVPPGQHGLLNPGALLGREVHARARLRLTLLGLALSGLILRLVLTRLSLLRLTLVTLLGLALVALGLALVALGLTLVALTLIPLAELDRQMPVEFVTCPGESQWQSNRRSSTSCFTTR
jgi:hypothetical protein